MTSSKTPSALKVFLLKNQTVPRDPYHEHFSSADFDPVFLPLLQHEFVGHEELKAYLESAEFVSKASALIITSQRAIEAVNAHLQQLDDEPRKNLLAKPVYTVGPATAKALSEAGYTNIRGGSEAGNGAVLAEIILKELVGKEEAVELVFFTGKTRRDIIPKRLTEAGVSLQERVVYQTFALNDIDVRVKQHLVKTLSSDDLVHAETATTPPGLEKHYLVFFSPAEADGVVETLLKMKERNCYLAAIGPTTEDYLHKNGLKPDVVALKPDAFHLLKGIEQHRESLRRAS